MNQLWQQCHTTVALLLNNARVSGEQIKGVGISAQGKGLFLLDKQDRPGQCDALLRPSGTGHRAALAAGRYSRKLYPHTRQTLWTGHPALFYAGSKRMSHNAISRLAA